MAATTAILRPKEKEPCEFKARTLGPQSEILSQKPSNQTNKQIEKSVKCNTIHTTGVLLKYAHKLVHLPSKEFILIPRSVGAMTVEHG